MNENKERDVLPEELSDDCVFEATFSLGNIRHQWYQPYTFVNHHYCGRCGITKKGSRGVKCKQVKAG